MNMAWTTGRILLQLSSHRVPRQSFVSTTTDGSSGQTLGGIGSLESETGLKLNMEGFPSASKGLHMEWLFSKWQQDHRSVHNTWHRYFKELVDNRAPASAYSTSGGHYDSSLKPGSKSGEKETLATKLGSVLADKGDPSAGKTEPKVPEKTTPEESQDDQSAELHKGIPKFTLFNKFINFRRQAASIKKTDMLVHRAQQIPGSKGGPRSQSQGDTIENNTMQFKSFYEEQQLNKEKAEQSKRKQDGGQDISKENKQLEKPQEKPQASLQGETPTAHTYKSLDALINDLYNATINMAWPDPIHQERVKKVKLWSGEAAAKLWKMPLDNKSFTDLPRALIDQSEKISEDKATEAITSDKATAGPEPENLQSPLGNATNQKPHQ